MKRYAEKLLTLCRFGDDLALLSTCKRKKCGAVVFTRGCTAVAAIGYNGPARSLPNDACTGREGECGCVHAETNAIAKLLRTGREPGLLMYCTHTPCHQCASLIVNSEAVVGFMYQRGEPHNPRALDILASAGIKHLDTQWISCVATGGRVYGYRHASSTLKEWRIS